MLNNGLGPFLLTCVMTATAFAAGDPFVGRWKLDAAKTKFKDAMRVESAGANAYTFDFGGGPETIRADGTDQPGISGTTLAVSSDAPARWTIVRKMGGHTVVTARWTLSDDGKTLTDDFTQFGSDGSPIVLRYVYDKSGSGDGIAGTWSTDSGRMTSDYFIEVKPWGANGLSFVNALAGQTKNVKFDGKQYPEEGPNVNPGAMASIRRLGDRAVEITEKVGDKIVNTQQITLSPDLKTLTSTSRPPGGGEPRVFIFDRQ
jgi:hypothetical protein